MNARRLLLLMLMAGAISCSPTGRNTVSGNGAPALSDPFVLARQVAPPPHIQSLQLHPQGDETAPPVIKLGRGALTLEFDDLDGGARQFRVSVSHRGTDWRESPIGPHTFLDGFFETTFGGGQQSYTQNPSYRHYTYTFPNRRTRITQSGNYLLSVRDYQTDELLFRMPFFVYEDRGSLDTRIEMLYTQRRDGRPAAQPFSTYRYPDFVKQPQFSLSFFYIQNRFWGRARQPEFYDTATPGEVHFHLARTKAFVANYPLLRLDIRSFETGRQITDIQPGLTPPVITLRRDVPPLVPRPLAAAGSAGGQPRGDRRAQYGDIRFALDADRSISGDGDIYLVGDFTQWHIEPRFRMRYDSTRGLWEGQALVKQGIYDYKYVRVTRHGIDDMVFDPAINEAPQHYLTLVYFRDPQRNFYRLLQIERTRRP